jgi:hypothetical protein
MDESRQRITGKLADKYILHAETEEDLELLEQVKCNPARLACDREELTKTPLEIALIGDCTAALCEVLAIVGLPPVEVDTDFIHIFKSGDYEAEFNKDSAGRAWHGNVMMKRQDLPDAFCRVLTHELAHLCSYRVIEVSLDRRDDGVIGLNIAVRRHGLGSLRRCGDSPKFRGLDEAATEAMAANLRQVLVRRPGALTDEERHRLDEGGVAYPAWMILLHDIVCLVGGEHGPASATKTLIIDLMGGTNRFLRALEALKKGSVRHLADLSPTVEDALKGAETLGFREAAEKIRSLLKKDS